MEINTATLRASIGGSNFLLQRTVDQVDGLLSAINGYAGDDTGLRATAFDAHRAMMNEGHVVFLTEYKGVLNDTIAAHNEHVGALGALQLARYSQSEIEAMIEILNRSIQQAEVQISSLRRMLIVPEVAIRQWERIIETLRVQVRKEEEKLERMAEFELATYRLYEPVATALDALEGKLLRLEHVQSDIMAGTFTIPSLEQAQEKELNRQVEKIIAGLTNKDGTPDWKALERALGRSYSEISYMEYRALATIFGRLDIAGEPNGVARFIRTIAQPIDFTVGNAGPGVINLATEWVVDPRILAQIYMNLGDSGGSFHHRTILQTTAMIGPTINGSTRDGNHPTFTIDGNSNSGFTITHGGWIERPVNGGDGVESMSFSTRQTTTISQVLTRPSIASSVGNLLLTEAINDLTFDFGDHAFATVISFVTGQSTGIPGLGNTRSVLGGIDNLVSGQNAANAAIDTEIARENNRNIAVLAERLEFEAIVINGGSGTIRIAVQPTVNSQLALNLLNAENPGRPNLTMEEVLRDMISAHGNLMSAVNIGGQ